MLIIYLPYNKIGHEFIRTEKGLFAINCDYSLNTNIFYNSSNLFTRAGLAKHVT